MVSVLILTHLCALGLGALLTLTLTRSSNPNSKIEIEGEAQPMSNKFVAVFEKIGEDIAKVVEFPFTEGAKIVTFIKAAETDAPAVIAAFDGLIAQGKSLGIDAGIEIAADGSNFADYLVIAKDAVAFGKYFKGTFLPVMEKAFEDAKAATGAPAATDPAPTIVASTAGATVVVQPGPGLHNVVAD